MRREVFFEYCNWLFPLLEILCKKIDVTNYSIEGKRVFAHIAERLLGVFVTYKRNTQKLRLSVRQWFYIEDSRRLPPAICPLDKDGAVPVLIFCSDYYVPYCVTTLLSLAKSSNPDRIYDIIIMSERVREESKKTLCSTLQKFTNVKIRFFDIEYYKSTLGIDAEFKKWAEKAVTNTAYNYSLFYRMFSPFLLYQFPKYVWIDCDVIVKEDIGKLFDADLNGCVAGGVHDPIVCSWLNGADKERQFFYKTEYPHTNVYNYINAGVLLLDAEKFREQYTIKQILNIIQTKPYNIIEQDALNLVLDNNVRFLDEKWNCFALGAPYPEQINFAPEGLYRKYQEARKHPAIIHYAGQEKPWNNPLSDFADVYWSYVRQTPFYEAILFRMMGGIHNSPHGYQSKARKLADKLLPKGTHRRNLAKKILPKGSRRWNFLKKAYWAVFKG